MKNSRHRLLWVPAFCILFPSVALILRAQEVKVPATAAPAPSPTTAATAADPATAAPSRRPDAPTTPMNTPDDHKLAPAVNVKTDLAALKKRLTPEQFRVTCEAGTEPPFRNAYWNEHRAGLYVDVITGEPLFTSLDKFESGTGWPSFTKPVTKENVTEHTDRAFGMARTEVRSKSSDAHLGHVFDDGPSDKGGMRYCMNSASLRFIPVEKLEAEGYGKYRALFEAKK